MIERIAILGTGCWARQLDWRCARRLSRRHYGWNRSPEGAQTALSMGALDSIAADPLQAARASQVVLLAVPIYATLDYMEKLAGELGSEHLITDVGSTKAQITAAAGRLFNTPERAAFLPAIRWRARSGAARLWAMQTFFAARCGSLPTTRPGSALLIRPSW